MPSSSITRRTGSPSHCCAGTASGKGTSWPAAIEAVAASLARVLERHGPQAIGVLGSARATNEDNYVIQKFARTVLGTNNVDCCARVCHTPSAAALKRMLGFGAATNSFDDIEQAGAFLLVGCNPTENHPVVGARILQQVRAGKPLVVIDPRATDLARRASVHLQPRAGTNIPLLNALAHVILEEGLADEAFVQCARGGAGRIQGARQQLDPGARCRHLQRACRQDPPGGTDLCPDSAGHVFPWPRRHRAPAGHRGRHVPDQPRAAHGQHRQAGAPV